MCVCMRLRVFFYSLFMKHTNLMFRLFGHFNKSSSLRVRDACASFLLSQVLFIVFTFMCCGLPFLRVFHINRATRISNVTNPV